MMKIEPSGVVMVGVCDIQTPKCQAKEPSAITAVWTLPGRSQINVCHKCMEEMVRTGEWEIPQSRISIHADIAVLDQDAKPVLVIEVKKRPYHDSDLTGFAARIHRNLVLHSGIPFRSFFLLALVPSPFYLWKPDSVMDPTAAPDFVIDYETEILNRRQLVDARMGEERIAQQLVYDWLIDVLSLPPEKHLESAEWLYRSGLLEKIRNGKVVKELRV